MYVTSAVTSAVAFAIPGFEGHLLPSALAGSAVVGGVKMNCDAARVIESSQYQDVAYSSKGVIVINPRAMRSYPGLVQRIIFLHECGHQYVGADEEAADCWAIKTAKKQDWLSKRGLAKLCRSFAVFRGGSVHMPGPARCEAMKRCYGSSAPSG